MWHERYLGVPSPTVIELAASRQPDLYLLTDCDVPFVQDGMRDGEHLREWMTGRFRQVLARQPAPWLEITGSWAERLGAAHLAVDALLRAGRINKLQPRREA